MIRKWAQDDPAQQPKSDQISHGWGGDKVKRNYVFCGFLWCGLFLLHFIQALTYFSGLDLSLSSTQRAAALPDRKGHPTSPIQVPILN